MDIFWQGENMKFEEFKSGVLVSRYQYQSFEPSLINQAWGWDDAVTNTLLESANRALGELNAFSLIVPDIDLFVRMHVMKEAQQSSRIEGTQTGMDEALMCEAHILPEKRDDWREVQNYVYAINAAIEAMKTLPLSGRLLKQTHRTLMQGVRGEHKQPGEFRTSQNWIGGSSLTDAVFIPAHPDNVADLMSDLEQFWHNDAIHVPHLIRVAISHYQFETIHPFLDGNGRIGRLMIPLYLISHGILAKPALYLSDFFERNRASYYDALMRVRTSNDLVHWVRFFLKGVAETANKGKNVFQEILKLRAAVEQEVLALKSRAQNARLALEVLYRQPIVSAADLGKALNISMPTAHKLVDSLVELGILKEITNQQRGRLYVFKKYFDLFVN
jgi:Fic family protein